MNVYSNSFPSIPNNGAERIGVPSPSPSKPPHVEGVNPVSTETPNEAELREAAENFETAFIAQMLKFSGLTEALTSGGGEGVAAFTDFYIESFAEDIVEGGGFGLADKFYEKLKLQTQDVGPRAVEPPKE